MDIAATPVAEHTPWWDQIPGMVVLLDHAGRLLEANRAFASYAGAADAAACARAWCDGLSAASAEALGAALRNGADFKLRLEFERSGAVGWIDCAGRWSADSSHWACLVTDVTSRRSTQHSVQTQAGLFRLLADNVPVLIAYYRAGDYRCQFANRLYARTFGRDEESIIGLTFSEVIGEAAAAEIQPMVDQVLDTRRAVAYERRLTVPGRDDRWIEVHLLPHMDDLGDVIGAFVLISDISKFRLAERAVRESEERLAKFMQASVEGIVFHRDGVITDANPPACDLSGYALEEMVGRHSLDFIAPEHVADAAAVLASGQETTYESMVIDKYGQRIPVEFIVRTMVRSGERMRMTIVRDIRDRRAAQARIHHLAHHDSLTGLPNRMSFMERIGQLMGSAQEGGSRLALLFIDLDHFKRVNDSLGHLVGDTLLRTVATRIVAALRATDVVARFGGDEFMVLLNGLTPGEQLREHVEEVAQKLIAAIEVPVNAEGRPISVTSSIGVALYPGDGESPDELVKHADSAMYLAKARGRANYQFFDPGMATSAYAALVMEGQLAQALERNEFVLFYQPQVRARDGVLIGAEALIRWNHPERGLLSPDEFIPLAERQRLMLPIGQWVLREAVRCATSWRERGIPHAPVAVNLSTMQFDATGFVESVREVLPEGAAGVGLLELELTERMLMEELDDVKKRLFQLKAMGVQIAVDDFGTGYSSLGHLKELPIDKVKIDQSFVRDLPGNADSVAIARAIIQMGKSLGLTVMAEGVENEAQRAFLAAQGCDELQGMLIGAPLSPAAFDTWLAARPGAATFSS